MTSEADFSSIVGPSTSSSTASTGSEKSSNSSMSAKANGLAGNVPMAWGTTGSSPANGLAGNVPMAWGTTGSSPPPEPGARSVQAGRHGGGRRPMTASDPGPLAPTARCRTTHATIVLG